MDELNIEKKYCVYCHINKINNKSYIGITGTDVQKRWGSNGGNYKRHKHFYNAIRKYGWNNFEHIILFNQLTKIEALKIEKMLIALFETQNPDLGYNMSPGGGNGTLGVKMSDETKNKISEALKGRQAWNKGKSMSDETRKKMSEVRKGIRLSDEVRAKMSESKKRSKSINAKKIVQYDKNGDFIHVWDSIKQASDTLVINRYSIGDCCRGKQKTAGGFIWKYAPIEMEDVIYYASHKF